MVAGRFMWQAGQGSLAELNQLLPLSLNTVFLFQHAKVFGLHDT
jgi:hypothetical protein